MRRFGFFLAFILAITAIFTAPIAAQSAAQATGERHPQTDSARFQIALLHADNSAGELAYTALATAPNGDLFAARPLTGEILRFDAALTTPQLIASGLTRPNALAYHDGALYIAAATHLYRWTQSDGLQTLVDDLPAHHTGYWTGGLAISATQRLYVGIGAACVACDDARASNGQILSFALAADGSLSDRRTVAQGLTYPAGLHPTSEARDGGVWVVDAAQDTLYHLAESASDSPAPLTAVYTFAKGSYPLAIHTSSAFEGYHDALWVVLSGTSHQSRLRGYEIVALLPTESAETPFTLEVIAPKLNDYPEHFLGMGFYPHHPYGIATAPNGGLYISTGGGRLYQLTAQTP